MRSSLFVLCIIVALTACRDKVICPAFQSTYILDDSVRMTYYSYLWKVDKQSRLNYLAERRAGDDTSTTASVLKEGEVDYFAYVQPYIVEDRDVNKSKFGIANYEPYWLKNLHLRTAPMQNILAPTPEEILPVDEGEFLASDFTDSTASLNVTATIASADSLTSLAQDSLGQPSSPVLAQHAQKADRGRPRYLYRYDPNDELLNVEQVYYNKYFGELLVDRRPRPEAVPGDSAALGKRSVQSMDSTQTGFIKGLFKRKKDGKGPSPAQPDTKPSLETTESSQTESPTEPPAGSTEEASDGF